MELKVDQKQMKAIQDEFARIPKIVSESARIVSRVMAARYAQEVRKEYMFGATKNAVSLKRGTLLKRSYGKRAGKLGGAIPAYGGSMPLFRTGTLASSVIINTFRKGGKVVRSEISISPRVILPGGGIAWKVALVHELGANFVVNASVQARVYLYALFEGKAGTAENFSLNYATKSISIHIPPRPVWRPVMARLLSRQPQEFAGLFHEKFNRKTRFNVVMRRG